MEYRFAGFRLDLVKGELSGPEGRIALRRQTFRLLEALLQHAPALVDRDQLIDEVWGRSALSRNALPQAISELRQALNDDPGSPRLIETRHRRGYRFIAPVERLCAQSATEASEPPATAAEPAAHPRPLRLIPGAIASAIVGAVILVMLLRLDGLKEPDPVTDTALLDTQTRLLQNVEEARREAQHDRVAGALRALVELAPNDVELRLDWVEAELAALRGDAARAALAALPAEVRSSRALRLRARIERLDGQLDSAFQLAAAAVEAARTEGRPEQMMAALREQVGILRASGQLAAADALLAAELQRFASAFAGHAADELILERVGLLRDRGLLAEARDLALQLSVEAPASESGVRQAIELALIDSESGDQADALRRLSDLAPDGPISIELKLGLANAWGTVLARSGEYDAARQWFDTAFEAAARHGAGMQLAALQVNAGLLFARQRRMEEAESLWLAALQVFEAVGDYRGQGVVLGNLAAAASARGQQARSEELNRRALGLFRRLELDGPLARTAFNLGLARGRAGGFAEARDLFAEAAARYAALGHEDAWLQVQASRVDLLLELGEFRELGELVAEATGAAPVSDEAAARFMAARARLAQRQGNIELARGLHAEAKRLREQAGLEQWVAQSDLELLRVDLLTDVNPVEVGLAAERLAARFGRWNEARSEALAFKLLAEALLMQDRVDEARGALAQARQAGARFPDILVDLELDWVEAWIGHPDEREPRLRALLDRLRVLGLRGTEQRYAVWLNGESQLATAGEVDAMPVAGVPPYVHLLRRANSVPPN